MLPIYTYFLFKILRAGGKMYFTAVNPGMYLGGLDENKKQILDEFPANLVPKSVLITAEINAKKRRQLLQAHEIAFPLIAKPDIGLRGKSPHGAEVEKNK